MCLQNWKHKKKKAKQTKNKITINDVHDDDRTTSWVIVHTTDCFLIKTLTHVFNYFSSLREKQQLVT